MERVQWLHVEGRADAAICGAQLQVDAGTSDDHEPGAQHQPVARLDDVERALLVETIRERVGVAGRHVHDDGDRHRE